MKARSVVILGGWGLAAGLGCQVDASGQGTASSASPEASTGATDGGSTDGSGGSTSASPDSSGAPDPSADATSGEGTTTSPETDDGPSATTGMEVQWLGDYKGRKAIRIHPGVDLVDFPVALTLGNDMDLAAGALPDGSDLMLTADDGLTELPFEIELFNAMGTLVVWADVGPLSAVEETVVYLYFGHDEPVPPQPDAETAWPERYEGVWHMRVDGLALRDSTASSNSGVAGNGGAAADEQRGVIGLAGDFDGNDTHVVGDPMDGTLDMGMDSFGLSAWVDIRSSTSTSDVPVHKGCTTAFDPGYGFFLGALGWHGAIADGFALEGVYFGEEVDLNGEWHHLVMSVDRGAGTIVSYLDGAQVDSIPLTVGSIDGLAPWAFSPSLLEIDGLLDEVRIERGVVDVDRARAHFVNVTEPEAFFTVGPVESPGG